MRSVVASLVIAALVGVAACAPRTAPAGTTPDGSGATSSVDAAQVGGGGALSLDELLRGRAPGLQVIALPDGGYTLRIRGLATASAGQEPLVLVDGVEIRPGTLHQALAGFTRDDIRKIEVLRDVASTSVYGMRGAGGVIVITTTRK